MCTCSGCKKDIPTTVAYWVVDVNRPGIWSTPNPNAKLLFFHDRKCYDEYVKAQAP